MRILKDKSNGEYLFTVDKVDIDTFVNCQNGNYREINFLKSYPASDTDDDIKFSLLWPNYHLLTDIPSMRMSDMNFAYIFRTYKNNGVECFPGIIYVLISEKDYSEDDLSSLLNKVKALPFMYMRMIHIMSDDLFPYFPIKGLPDNYYKSKELVSVYRKSNISRETHWYHPDTIDIVPFKQIWVDDPSTLKKSGYKFNSDLSLNSYYELWNSGICFGHNNYISDSSIVGCGGTVFIDNSSIACTHIICRNKTNIINSKLFLSVYDANHLALVLDNNIAKIYIENFSLIVDNVNFNGNVDRAKEAIWITKSLYYGNYIFSRGEKTLLNLKEDIEYVLNKSHVPINILKGTQYYPTVSISDIIKKDDEVLKRPDAYPNLLFDNVRYSLNKKDIEFKLIWLRSIYEIEKNTHIIWTPYIVENTLINSGKYSEHNDWSSMCLATTYIELLKEYYDDFDKSDLVNSLESFITMRNKRLNASSESK